MGQWWMATVLTSNPEQDGSPFWGYINSDRATAVKATMIHDSATGYNRDVYYPEIISADLGTTRLLLNLREGLGFLTAGDCELAIKEYIGGRDV